MKKENSGSTSPAWDYFMEQFFTRTPYLMWHDGIDPSCLLELSEKEREEAENLLIQSVEDDGMWPAEGLAVLNSKKAVPVLKKKLETSNGVIRIRVAFALEKIERTGEYIHILIQELKNSGLSHDQLEAARKLREFPVQETIDALYEGMLNKEYLVRYHCAESLLEIHGIKDGISSQKKIFKYIIADSKKDKDAAAGYATAVKLMKKKLRK